MKRLHIIVTGRVQGVFFRHCAKIEAEKLCLKGYVKNLSSGDVEIVAEGSEKKLKMLLEWSRRGPDHAHVSSIKADYSEYKDEFKFFNVRY